MKGKTVMVGQLALALMVAVSPRLTQASTLVATSIGPFSGEIPRIAVDPTAPSTLYAAARYSGLFKSTDAAQSWTALASAPVPADIVVIDPLTPTRIYLVSSTQVLKSSDSGVSWQAMGALPSPFDPFDGWTIQALAIDPSTPTTLYAGANFVFKSTDSGDSWSLMGLGTWPRATCDNDGCVNVFTLAIDSSNPTTVYAGTSSGVLKSTNGGETWTAGGYPSGWVSAIVIDPITPTTVYAGMETNSTSSVWKSTDGGNTWTAVGPGDEVDTLAIDPTAPTTLYAGMDAYNGGGLWKSTDGGANWTAITALTPTCLIIAPGTSNIFYAGTLAAGLFKSTDAGASWMSMSSGMTGGPALVEAIALDPNDPKVLYAGLRQGIAKSADGGTNWTRATDNVSIIAHVRDLAIDPSASSTLYAATTRGVLKSTDAGVTWTAMNSGLGNIFVWKVVVDPSTPSTLNIATEHDGVFKSTDGAASWTVHGLTGFIRSLVADSSTPGVLYAGGHPLADQSLTEVFKSTDAGDSWTSMSVGLGTLGTVLSLAVDPSSPNTLYAGTENHFGSVSNGSIFKSTDGAATWSVVGESLRSIIDAIAVDPSDPNIIYAGGRSAFYVSTNGGFDWELQSSLRYSLDFAIAPPIDPDLPSTLYAAGVGFDDSNAAVRLQGTSPAAALASTSSASPGLYRIQRLPRAIAKGKSRTGCQVQWFVENSSVPVERLVCADGDPLCDAKANQAGVCEFRVMVCLNNADSNLPLCTPKGISEIAVRDPNPKRARDHAWRPILAADVAAHEHALRYLLDPTNPGAGYINAAPLSPQQQHFCSAPFGLDVALGTSHRKSVTLTTRSADYSSPLRLKGTSRLKLICKANPTP